MSDDEILLWCKRELERQMNILATPPLESVLAGGIRYLRLLANQASSSAQFSQYTNYTIGSIEAQNIINSASGLYAGYEWTQSEIAITGDEIGEIEYPSVIDPTLYPDGNDFVEAVVSLNGYAIIHPAGVIGVAPSIFHDPLHAGFRGIVFKPHLGAHIDLVSFTWEGARQERNNLNLISADYGTGIETLTLNYL